MQGFCGFLWSGNAIDSAAGCSRGNTRTAPRLCLSLGLSIAGLRSACALGLALAIACAVLPVRSASADTARTRITLSKGWFIRQLDDGAPDIAALTKEAARPGEQWLKATMPAQVHDILLARGRIPDPRIGRNAAQGAWVGRQDWVYACTFASPVHGNGPVFLHVCRACLTA